MEISTNSGLKTQRTTQSSESNLLKIVNANLDGMVVVNKEGVILYANPAAETLFGYKGKELLGIMIGFPVLSGKPDEVNIHHKGRKPITAEMRVVEIEWEDKKSQACIAA